MDKMKMQAHDPTQSNIKKITALFPNHITASVGEYGKSKKAINFEILKQRLFDNVLDEDEYYEFTRTGKKDAIVEAHKPIRKILHPCKEESVNWNNTENLYIAKRKPLRAVFRNSGSADSPAKITVTKIFKLLAPDMRIKVI